MALRTVGVKLMADVSQYTAKMKQAGGVTRDLGKEMKGAASSGHLDSVADQAAGAGLALAGVAGAAVKLSMDFEKSMSGVSAATHGSAQQMDQLRAAALKAGKDTQYSATKAADAITELSKAGVSTADILNGGLDGALDLAAAGQLDVAEAAETAASAMTQFKLKGDKIPHVADLLAAAAGKAQGTVHDMGAALNQAGLVAAQTGLSIEETTGGLAAFASAGLTGSDAGTSFKQMLLMLQAPSDKTKAQMDDLGISLYDNSGQFLGLTNLAQQLKEKMSSLTPELRANAMAQIFGADAVRGASILYEQGGAGIQDWIEKVDDAGYASETAAKLTDNLSGDIERLTGSLETLAIEAGGGANGGLRVIVQAAGAMVDEFSALPTAISGTATVLAALGGTVLLGGAAWVKMRRSNAEAMAELRATGPAGERAAKGLQSTAKWAGRVTAAFVAFEVAQAAVSSMQTDLDPKIEALASGLEGYADTGQLAGEASRVLGGDLKDLDGQFQILADSSTKNEWARGLQGGLESIIPGLDGTNTSLKRTKERVDAMDRALAQLVSGGKATEAKKAFDRLGKTLAVNGVTLDEFKKQFPEYAAAVEVAGKASATTAGDIEDVGDASDQTAEQMEELNKQIEDLFDSQMSADRAALKFEDSLGDLHKELKTGTRTLSLNSVEGRKNRGAVLDNLEAIEDLRRARIKEGMTLDEANRKYGKDIDGLRKTMRQLGFTEDAVDDLTGKYKRIPKQVQTKVTTPGLTPAQTSIKDYDKKLDGLARKVKTEISVSGKAKAQRDLESLLIAQQAAKKGITISEAKAAFRKNAGSYHAGGWTGPGGKYDEAGVVHADEHVIRKESRRKLEAKHPGLLDEMNATGQIPGYAGGGKVLRMPFRVNAAVTDIMSMADALSKVSPSFGGWPSSPSAQRGDSGIWRKIVTMIRATGPLSGSFGNGYRPGDPKWHGSGRAVDWMGFNQDALARFLVAKRPLELIHRTRQRDYAYTRGKNKGSFNNALMNAHKNHVHIAMRNGGTIREPVYGVGASGKSYGFGEGYRPERVVPMSGSSSSSNCDHTVTLDLRGDTNGMVGRALISDLRKQDGIRVTVKGLLAK